jgi:hypothetical protein
MALANVRERLALHFDAEASLDSRITKDAYEVHIRMPYRTADPDAAPAPGPAANGASRNHQRQGGTSKRVAASVHVSLVPGGAEVRHV